MKTLHDILTYRRAHDSEGERAFIEQYLAHMETLTNDKGEVLAYVVRNQEPSDHHNILWSAHIDTMHKATPDIRQEIYIDGFNTAFVDDKADCLGADNGAGVWLLFEMIDAGVSGTYIFHRGEERGCWGSKQLADQHSDWLKTFTHAIAFDRRGTTSIITHQRGGRACSDTLGQRLIDALGMNYQLDDTGIYTDVAEYAHLIPECVNISIGYANEHGNKETLDLDHAQRLRDRMLAIDWHNLPLPADRTPAELMPSYNYGSFYGGLNSYSANSYWDDEDASYFDLMHMDAKQLLAWTRKNSAHTIADVLDDLLLRIQMLEDELGFMQDNQEPADYMPAYYEESER